MVVNLSKTEFVIFGYHGPYVQLNLSEVRVKNVEKIRVLGVIFQSNMKWTTHVNSIIKGTNAFCYSLRILNQSLSRQQHRQVIHSHIISRISYAMPVWGGNLNTIDRRRLNTLLFKVVRLHCRDFSRILTNKELCETAKIRSMDSIRIISDAKQLHGIVTSFTNTQLTLRLIQQTTVGRRYPDNLVFCDFSRKKIGSQSFINRAKRISELIPFAWIDLSPALFSIRMKRTTPIFISN